MLSKRNAQPNQGGPHTPRRPRFVWVLLPLMLLLLLHPKSVAEPSETIADALARHHIELTQSALVEALRNPDKEVRGLAAWQLLETKANDSLPQIMQALRDESDPATKVNLASAAAYFGAKEGTAELAKVCHESGLPASARIDAARHLFDLKDHSCMPDLLKLITSASDSETRVMVLNLVSPRPGLTPAERAQMTRVSVEMLRDKQPRYRLKAAVFLANLHDTNAIPYLRRAIQVERDEPIRSQMQSSLNSLLVKWPAP